MKKNLCIVLTTLLLFLYNFQAKSQLADGTIAPDWTLVDINGNSHHLYDYLNAGKTVVIDISAVWCGPCWYYHTSGALESFYAQHGPDGDNTAMVFFIEGDQGTLAQLNGGSGSQGDWVTGTPYPIIPTYAPNGQSVCSAYSISYFPTCYMICAADKKTKKVDQYTAAELNTAMSGCPSITVPPVANFYALSTQTCTGAVQFSDQSTIMPSAWLWDFGDGQTSTLQNPLHTYTANGTYTVSLLATNNYGNNTMTKSNYINVNLPPTPTTTGATIASAGSVTLSASGSGILNWYDASSGGNLVNTGTTYTTPVLNYTTTYYVENSIAQPVQTVGLTTNTTDGAYYTNVARWALAFNALVPLTINTVKVYSNAAGDRTIWLANSGGMVMDSIAINIPSGEQTITLNLHVPAGSYQLGANSACNLWRDASGGVFPYTVSDLISITGNTAGSGATAYYYYFYNWQVQADPCISPRAEVKVLVGNGIDEEDASVKYDLYPNPNNGEFILNINSRLNDNIAVTVLDINGKIVYSEHLHVKGKTNKKFDFGNFPKGVYFLKLVNSQNVHNEKIIIE